MIMYNEYFNITISISGHVFTFICVCDECGYVCVCLQLQQGLSAKYNYKIAMATESEKIFQLNSCNVVDKGGGKLSDRGGGKRTDGV